MKKIILLVTVLFLVTNVSFARKGKGGECRGLIHKELGLTNEQVDKLHDLKKDQRENRHEHKKKMMDLKHELDELLLGTKPNEGKIKSKIDEIAEMHKKQMLGRFMFMVKMKSILTPEQVKKMDLQHMFKRKHRGGGKGKGRMGNRDRGWDHDEE